MDCIDRYQVHWPPTDGTKVENYWATQIDGWLDGSGLQLTDDDLDVIAAAITSSDAGTEPSRPATAPVP